MIIMTAATRDEISNWFDRGVSQGHNYMIVMCDTFDWEDYPIFCETKLELGCIVKNPGSMERVMETYDLNQPKEPQMLSCRNFV